MQSATQLESGQGPTVVEVVKAEVEDSTAEASDSVARPGVPDLEHSDFSEGPGAVGSQEVSEPSVIPPKLEVVDIPSVATENPGSGVDLVAVGAQEASEPASASDKPGVVDTAVVATSTLGLDTSSLVAPPTSPNLVESGVEPIRTGHWIVPMRLKILMGSHPPLSNNPMQLPIDCCPRLAFNTP